MFFLSVILEFNNLLSIGFLVTIVLCSYFSTIVVHTFSMELEKSANFNCISDVFGKIIIMEVIFIIKFEQPPNLRTWCLEK